MEIGWRKGEMEGEREAGFMITRERRLQDGPLESAGADAAAAPSLKCCILAMHTESGHPFPAAAAVAAGEQTTLPLSAVIRATKGGTRSASGSVRVCVCDRVQQQQQQDTRVHPIKSHTHTPAFCRNNCRRCRSHADASVHPDSPNSPLIFPHRTELN